MYKQSKVQGPGGPNSRPNSQTGIRMDSDGEDIQSIQQQTTTNGHDETMQELQ